MPRVPTYTETQTLNPLARAPARAARPGDPLRDVGAGLQDGGALGNIALRQQQQRNVERTMTAESHLKDMYREFETQTRERRGTNAWGATEDAQSFFEKQTTAIAGKLENDEQRSIFKLTADQLRQQSLTAISRFESRERHAAVEDATKASIAGSINLAARHATDPEAVATAREDVLKRTRVLAQTNGWSAERIEVETTDTLTALHGQVLQAMVDINPVAARAYLTANADDIAGARLDEFNALVKTGERRATAQGTTDAIMSKGLTETQALKEARKISDPDARDDTVARVKTRYAEADAARLQSDKERADAAWKIFAETGTVASLSTALLQDLDGRTILALRHAEGGDTTETDWNHYTDLREQAQNDPAAFALRDIRQDFPRLAETERRQVIALQEAARDPAQLPDAASTEKQIEVALNLLDIGGTQKDKEKKGQFQSAVYSEIAAFTQRAGREPSGDERQAIIDRLVIEGEIPGFIFNRDRRAFEVYGTDQAGDFTADIPDDMRARIVSALEAGGDPVTERDIIDIWLRYQDSL